MPGALGQAAVEVVAEIDARQVNRALADAFKSLQRDVARSFAGVEDDIGDRGAKAGKAFGGELTDSVKGIGDDIARALDLDDVGDQFARGIGEGVSDAVRDIDRLDGAATEFRRNAKGQFVKAGDDLEESIGKARKSAVKDLDRIDDKAEGLGTRFGGLKGLIGGAAAALATVGIGRAIGGAITDAADLGESLNAINVILGEEAGAAFAKFGESSANNLGIAQAELNDAVVPLASLLSNADLGGDALAGALEDVATRATDVASVMNKDVNEVLEAFGAAVRGETEPIRALGVNFDAAAVSAKAVELGLAGAGEEASNAALTQARLALVLEQTDAAAGDFANTANSLPNVLKRLKAQGTDLATSFGGPLLTAVEGVAGGILAEAQGLEEPLGQIGAGLGEALGGFAPVLSEATQGIAPTFVTIAGVISDTLSTVAPVIGEVLGNIAPVLGEVVTIVGELIQAFAPLLVPVSALAAAVGGALLPVIGTLVEAIGPVIALFADELLGVVVQLTPVLADLGLSLAEVAVPLIEALAPILPVLVGLLVSLVPVITAVADAIGFVAGNTEVLVPILGGLVAGFVAYKTVLAVQTAATKAFAAVQAALNVVLSANPIGIVVLAITALVAGIVIAYRESETFRDIVDGAFRAVGAAAAAVVDWFVAIATNASEFVTAVREKVGDVIGFFQDLPGDLVSAASSLGSNLLTFVGDALSRVGEAVVTHLGEVVGFYAALPGRIVDGLSSLTSTVVGFLGTALSAVGTFIFDAVTAYVQFYVALPGRIVDALGSLGSTVVGFLSGALSSVATFVATSITNLVTFYAALPGRVVSAVGNLGQTIITGLSTGVANLVTFAGGIVDDVVGAFTSLPGKALGIGKDVVRGLIDGILSLGGTLAANVRSFITRNVPDVVQRLLGISSPSKVFAELGEFTIQGYIDGVTSMETPLRQAVEQTIGAALDGVGTVQQALASQLGLDDAKATIREAERELQALLDRRDALPAEVERARAALQQARIAARVVTPEEELAILRAADRVSDAEDELRELRKDGEATARDVRQAELELTLSRQALTETQREAKGATAEVTEAEEALKALQQEQRGITDELTEAQEALTDARNAYVAAQVADAKAQQGLQDLAPGTLGLFEEYAAKAGLSAGAIDALTGSIVGLQQAQEALVSGVVNVAQGDEALLVQRLINTSGGVRAAVEAAGVAAGPTTDLVDVVAAFRNLGVNFGKAVDLGDLQALLKAAGVPGFARGGIFDRATLGVFGEAGPEAIIPLSNEPRARQLLRESGLDRLSGQGGTTVVVGEGAVQITVPNVASYLDARRAGAEAAAELLDRLGQARTRRSGVTG